MKEYHLIEPIYDKDSKILILGSFPSVKSREANFFYHHPQNRFWRDVIASCNIKGSSDSSISDVEVNDLNMIIANSSIKHIYTNGNLADKLYHRYFDTIIDLPVTKLPSTSPANAAYLLEKLLSYWRVINE